MLLTNGLVEHERLSAEPSRHDGGMTNIRVGTRGRTSSSLSPTSRSSWWTKTFTDPRLCAEIVDWLTFGGNIIETGTASATPSPTGPPCEGQRQPVATRLALRWTA